MHEQPRWRRYLRFWGPDPEADIDDDIRFHLEMRERDFLAAGLPAATAREEALARFGDPAEVARRLRDHDARRLRRLRRIEAMSDLLQDARYGWRRLWKAPGFTLAVVLVLALGIGATTAIFSVIDAALLRPLPYPEPERLVAVYHPGQIPGGDRAVLGVVDPLDQVPLPGEEGEQDGVGECERGPRLLRGVPGEDGEEREKTHLQEYVVAAAAVGPGV